MNSKFLLIAALLLGICAALTPCAHAVDVTVRVTDQFGVDIPDAGIEITSVTYPTGSTVSLAEGTLTIAVRPAFGGGMLSASELVRSETVTVTATTTVLQFEWAMVPVTLNINDQFGTPIPGAAYHVSHSHGEFAYVPSGQSVLLPTTDESIYPTMNGTFSGGIPMQIAPGIDGIRMHPYQLSRQVYVEVPGDATTLNFTWAMVPVTVNIVDQFGAPIPGATYHVNLYFGDVAYVPSGQSVLLPTTDESIYPTMTGGYATDGIPLAIAPAIEGVKMHPYLFSRREYADVPGSATTFQFEWEMVPVTVTVRDQYGSPVPGAGWDLSNYFGDILGAPSGQTILLPTTDESLYPTMTGEIMGGFPFRVRPSVGGVMLPADRLSYISDRFEIGSGMGAIDLEWAHLSCHLQIVDANDQVIPNAAITVRGFPFFNYDPVYLPITDESVYPTMQGLLLGGFNVSFYSDENFVGASRFEVTADLEFSPPFANVAGSDYGLRCGPAPVTFRVVDQHGNDIPGSTVAIYTLPGSPLLRTGESLVLEEGTYRAFIWPGILGREVRVLMRDDPFAISATTDTITFVWPVTTLNLDVIDQYGQPIPSSQWVLRDVTGGDPLPFSAVLPVSEDPAYPGIMSNGYMLALLPGLVGGTQPQLGGALVHNLTVSLRTGSVEYGPSDAAWVRQSSVTVPGGTVAFIWPTAPLTFDLEDQFGDHVPASLGGLQQGTNHFIAQALALPFTVTMPVTDDPALPNLYGEFASGYQPAVWPGFNGLDANQTSGWALMRRFFGYELTASGRSDTFEWAHIKCAASLIDGAGAMIPGSNVTAPQFGATYANFDQIYLPVTDESYYPTMEGSFRDGYPLTLYPGGTLAGHATFEVTAALEFSPAFATIGGQEYGLRCIPPVGAVQGRALANCTEGVTPLLGVRVDAYASGSGDLVQSTVTDAQGYFQLTDLHPVQYTITIVTPLGYTTTADEMVTTVLGGGMATVDFGLSCVPISANPRTIGFWKHQVGVATGGNGAAQITSDALCSYLDLIEAHFNSNAINQVVVYQPPLSGLCPDKLAVAKDLLNLKGNAGMLARARQQLTALLFNVAAGFVSLGATVSVDGATLSQAITHSDLLIDDPAGDHERAKSICDLINNNLTVPAGWIPLSTADIAYKQGSALPEQFTLDQNYPNPFNAGTIIPFVMKDASSWTLTVFNVMGQSIRSFEGFDAAGVARVEWDGRDRNGLTVPSGVYFYRVNTSGWSATRKMTLLK